MRSTTSARLRRQKKTVFVLAPTKTDVRRVGSPPARPPRLLFLAERGGASPLSRESSKALVRALIDLRARREPDPDDLSSLVDALPVRGTRLPQRCREVSASVEIAGAAPCSATRRRG